MVLQTDSGLIRAVAGEKLSHECAGKKKLQLTKETSVTLEEAECHFRVLHRYIKKVEIICKKSLMATMRE